MRLEVISSSGEVFFDSNFKSANLIDWPASDKQGHRIADGSYLCVVTIKDSAGQLTRKQAIASLRGQSLGLKQADNSLLTAAQAQAAAPDDPQPGGSGVPRHRRGRAGMGARLRGDAFTHNPNLQARDSRRAYVELEAADCAR